MDISSTELQQLTMSASFGEDAGGLMFNETEKSRMEKFTFVKTEYMMNCPPIITFGISQF